MTSLLLRSFKPITAQKAGFIVLGMCGSTFPAVSTKCEGGLPKDRDGNIEWSKIPNSLMEPGFWDDVAKGAGESLQGAIDSGIPTQLSYGFISGYCSGMALKKAGRAAAVVLGLGFVCLQTLSYSGYIEVDHVKIKKGVEDMFDLNADGKVDNADRKIATDKVMEVLQFNMPAGGGFAAGFIGGLRSG